VAVTNADFTVDKARGSCLICAVQTITQRWSLMAHFQQKEFLEGHMALFQSKVICEHFSFIADQVPVPIAGRGGSRFVFNLLVFASRMLYAAQRE